MAEFLAIAMFALACFGLMGGYNVAFTLSGVSLIFAALGVATGTFDAAFLLSLPGRIYPLITREILMAVPLFVFMGVMLEKSRIAEDLLESMGDLFGPLKGGLGISVVFVGALLAASTGIVGATVVTMGLLSLPTMLKRNYAPSLASGSIAASGTLGQIIPPSIVLVILGDQMSNAYQEAQRSFGLEADYCRFRVNPLRLCNTHARRGAGCAGRDIAGGLSYFSKPYWTSRRSSSCGGVIPSRHH